ncbi:MAG: energy transducer TonB [Ferruginibacter sp.]|nr:energy transducer TonB [Ferruginibacter sp.]
MITKFFIFLLAALASLQSYSQQVTNVVMVGPGGVTDDSKTATSFIVVKQFPDNRFERLDYKKGGPMTKLRSFKGEELKVLDGRYFEYAANGTLILSGKYSDNKKNDYWRSYNDTGKILSSIKYLNDSIVEVDDLNKKASSISYPDEREAAFPGGQKAWVKYLQKKLGENNPADKSFHGGKVYVNFVVGTDGKVQELFVSKSVEFILDETSLEIIGKAPDWIPAFQNGKTVRAYRRQPLTFIQE